MLERTYSHKSDGRQSSTGHSVHSAVSRANSLGIDTFPGLGAASPDAPGLAPGLFLLGTVPAIIRCWLNTKFKHESLLYAAVCTGSYTSYIHLSLVETLGFLDQIRQEDDMSQKVKLSVYLPEAVVRNPSSRPSISASQLPNVTVDFTVISHQRDPADSSIQVFIGSDILKAHNADILFSSNSITLFDDELAKLSIQWFDQKTTASLRACRYSVLLHRLPSVKTITRNRILRISRFQITWSSLLQEQCQRWRLRRPPLSALYRALVIHLARLQNRDHLPRVLYPALVQIVVLLWHCSLHNRLTSPQMNRALQAPLGLLRLFGESGGASLTKETKMNGALQWVRLTSGGKRASKYFDLSKLLRGLCRGSAIVSLTRRWTVSVFRRRQAPGQW